MIINFLQYLYFQDFELNMFFRQYWKDLRMAFDEGNDGVNNLILNARAINDVMLGILTFSPQIKTKLVVNPFYYLVE